MSGKTPARIASIAGVLADWMAGEGAGVPLADVAHTVNHHAPVTRASLRCVRVIGRRRWPGCGHWRPATPAVGVVEAHEGPCGSGTVFLYSGQGSQWAGMGRQLLADEPAFAAAVAELEPEFVAQVGFSLRDVLVAGEPVVGIERIQPVLVGMQLALTALWRSYGVEPDAVIGHSMGEVTAAVVAGALSPADGLKVIATRSKLMSRLSGQGAMALLELGAEAAEKLVGGLSGYHGGGVCLAAADGDRRAARAGRRGDRGGGCAGPVGASRRGGRGLAPSHRRSDIARITQCAGRFGAGPAEDSVDQHDRAHQRQTRCSTPTTGWPICVIRCGSARLWPPPRKTTPRSSKSARIRC